MRRSTRTQTATLAALSGALLVSAAAKLIWVLTGSNSHGWLNWNLFLAFCPLAFAWLSVAGFRVGGRAGALLPGLLWLCFLPNAPYMLTDLIHVGDLNPQVPAVADAAIIGVAALAATTAGFLSLLEVETLLRRAGLGRTAFVVRRSVLVLASVGVWLGRVARWNSWDITRKPGQLVVLLVDRVAHAYAHPLMWAGVAAMTLLLGYAYRGFCRLVVPGFASA